MPQYLRWQVLAVWAAAALPMALMAWVGQQNGLGWFFYAALVLVLLSFIHQHWQAKTQGRAGCFQAFLNNHYSGLLLFAGIGLDLL